ncbi:MAG: transcriptional repressor [Clostridia bacterium]|nr:transcriptional repressor [Clostridia bacterium]
MNFSKQRESILEYLRGTKEHPTAERIYSDLKQDFPKLSLATVYRNCNQLCEMGKVVRLTTNGKTDHFDADTSDHQHFVCTECDGVYDLFFALPKKILDENLDDEFQADFYQLYVYGTCRACRKSKTA